MDPSSSPLKESPLAHQAYTIPINQLKNHKIYGTTPSSSNLHDLSSSQSTGPSSTSMAGRGWASPTSALSPQDAAFVFNGIPDEPIPGAGHSAPSLSFPSSHRAASLTIESSSHELDNINNNNDSTSSTSDRRRASWLTLLVLPARLAVGALTFFAGARLTVVATASSSSSSSTDINKHVLTSPWGILGGATAAALSQLLINYALSRTRRLRARNNKEAEIAAQQRINWLDAIQAVGKIVDRFANGLGAPDTLASVRSMFLDVSLARLVHLSTLQRNIRLARVRSTSTADSLARGRHYLDFALASYGYILLRLTGVVHADYDVMVEGSRGEDVARYLLGLKESDDMMIAHLDGEEISLPRHFVALDHTYRAVVISIRGTNSVSDIITDLICSNEVFGSGYAHGGMKSSAEILCNSLLPTLHDLRERFPRYTLVTTGHSLGAGVAILLTKLLLNAGFADVRCYAFAPCPVFGPLHHVDSEWSDALECFVHTDDMVATLCLSSARRLALEIERIDKRIELDIRQKQEIVNGNQASVIEDLLAQSRARDPDPREEEVDQLFIPCHRGVHWLIPEDEDEREQPDSRPLRAKSGEDITDHNSLQHENEASKGYNDRWGRRIRRERRKKWIRRVRAERDNVPPAYVPVEKFRSYIVRPRMFEKILVTPNCVNHHFPNMYTAAFAGLDLPPRERPLPPKPKPNFTRPWYSNELG